MKIVVGLGNPGEKYKRTRHNVGFMVLDTIASIYDLRFTVDEKFEAEMGEIGEKAVLVKPLTFMNKSGDAVKKIQNSKFKIQNDFSENLFVIHDDLDLPMGRLQIRKNIGAAGHHGVESIVEGLGTRNFARFRLGVRLPACDITTAKKAKDYLLSDFSNEEIRIMRPSIERAAAAVLYAVEYGVEKAMGKYN